MPLLPVPRPISTGGLAEWWEPIPTTFDPRSGRVELKVGVFKDEDAYLAGAQPTEVHRFTVPAERIAALGGPALQVTALLYQLALLYQPFAPPPPAEEIEAPPAG